MFVRIIIKNYKKNLGKYMIYSLCNVLTVSMIYLFWSIMTLFTQAGIENNAVEILFSDIQWDLLLSCVVITLVSVFMMFIAFKNYIWLRIQDYSMYMTLGMRNRRFLAMLGLEYLANWIVSFAIGLLLGKGLLLCAVHIINRYTIASFSMQGMGAEAIKRTFYVCIVTAFIVFLGILTWLEDKNIGDIRDTIHANEKRPESKWWGLGALVSIGFVLIAYALYLQGDWPWFYSHFLWVFAGMILVIAVLGMVLVGLKKREAYYHQLVWINGLYSKYINSVIIISVLFCIHFFVLGYAANWIANCLPIGGEEEKYRSDYVWMDREKNENSVMEIVNKYGGSLEKLPMIRVYDFDENIGISEESYEKLTGETIDLKGQEILFSAPNRKSNKRKECESKIEYLHLYPGKYTNSQFLLARGQSVSENYAEENTFVVKYQISENVLGDYSRSVLPNSWPGSIIGESLFVFSDEYFETCWRGFCENESEPTELFLMNFPEETRKQAGVELQQYAEKYGIKTQKEMGTFQRSHFYDTSQVINMVRGNVLFYLVCGVIIGLDLFLCSIFIFGLNLLTRYRDYRRKYQLLYDLGTRAKKCKQNLHREIAGEMWFSLGVALLLALLYSGCCLKGTIAGGRAVWSGYWKWWIGVSVIYFAVNCVAVEIFYRMIYKKIQQEGEV